MSKHFKIFCIYLVKNEADIVEYSLSEASKWADRIYVYDGQSSDGTWEKVMALQDNKIIPWKQDGKVFQESLRGEVFNHFRHEANKGDWWCHLDADEIFNIQNPREFLSKVPWYEHVVWGTMVEYYLIQQDLGVIDFSRPVSEILPQIKHYRANNCEPRFFRYRKGLQWGSNDGWPRHMGVTHNERILFRHYKYRSPGQIQFRLRTRQEARNRGFPGWSHAIDGVWQDKLADLGSVYEDLGDSCFIVDESISRSHLDPFYLQVFKRLMHGFKLWP
jgi:hypothetical protein